jgi:hypothetical protein
MNDFILTNDNADGIDRRSFLYMAGRDRRALDDEAAVCSAQNHARLADTAAGDF